jgi:hypothetical protein
MPDLMPQGFKAFLDAIFDPILYTVFSIALFAGMLVFYRHWTKPKVALGLLFILAIFFALSWGDPNFNKIVAKPDNVPIVALIFILGFFIWLPFRQAAINDERIEKGLPTMEAEEKHDRVLVWPDLVFIEFLCAILFMAVLIVWSIYLKAPLEEPANPMRTPNPSKAPWYFLGLQEMLVYFDPWLAGVVLPTMIITGLIAIPYCDKNPKGNGYYTLKERPFAIAVFMFGFLVLWISLIIMGTALRGPNWNFFGLYEYWDSHKLLSLNNVNLSEYVWVGMFKTGLPENILIRELPGFLLIGAYMMVTPAVLLGIPMFQKLYKEMGFMRYSIMMVHLLVMMSMVLKMLLRWTINLKYIIAIPEYFFNI